MSGGFLTSLKSAVTKPSESMSWMQLAAATIFVVVVLFAWRQVVYVAREI